MSWLLMLPFVVPVGPANLVTQLESQQRGAPIAIAGAQLVWMHEQMSVSLAESPEVTVVIVEEHPGKPPLVRLIVNVTATNPTAANQWVLVQRKAPSGRGGVDKLEQLTAGNLTYGRFLGQGGFYAFLLAPGGTLTLHNLEIQWWRATGVSAGEIEVRTGTALTLGGTDAASWFDGIPTVFGDVEIDANKAAHTHSRKAPDDREVAVVVSGEVTKRVVLTR
jgi:hypothetical protein